MKYFLLVLSHFLIYAVKGQQNNDVEIITPADLNIQHKLNYSSIEIKDSRFDTTKIGYVKSGNKYKKIATQESLSLTLQNHLNTQLAKQLDISSSQNLLVVIKKLWLQQTNADELDDRKISRTFTSVQTGFAMCTLVFDVYLRKGSIYIPLLKIDTSLFSSKSLHKDAGYLVGFAMENCINQIASIDPGKFKNRKTLSMSDIEQYNNKRLAYPRYKNDTPIRGIFPTFKDFLNNKPVDKNFMIQSGKITDELYVEQNGEAVLLENFWGFCDGEKNYLHIGFNFFEITRQSDTYELWGSKSITEKSRQNNGIRSLFSGVGVETSPAITKKTKLDYKPLQLDMETGRVY
jgi:hypothetical protein